MGEKEMDLRTSQFRPNILFKSTLILISCILLYEFFLSDLLETTPLIRGPPQNDLRDRKASDPTSPNDNRAEEKSDPISLASTSASAAEASSTSASAAQASSSLPFPPPPPPQGGYVFERSRPLTASEEAVIKRFPPTSVWPAQQWLPRWVGPGTPPDPVKIVFWGTVYGENARQYFSVVRNTTGLQPVPCPVPCGASYMGSPDDTQLLSSSDGLIMHGTVWWGHPSLTKAIAGRPLGQAWMVNCEESASNAGFIASDQLPETFNYTNFYSLLADFPIFRAAELTPASLAALPPASKRAGKVLCLFSNCATHSSRDAKIASLSQALGPGWVDCMGKCQKNKPFPADLGGDHEIYGPGMISPWERKAAIQQRYKFDLVIQNSLCADFIDEKLYKALQNGNLPIYDGAWNIEQYLIPGEKMVILLSDWEGNMQGLANYIKYLDSNETAYMEYFAWHRLVKDTSAPYIIPALRGLVTGSANEFCYLCQAITRNRILKVPGNTYRASPDKSCCDNAQRGGCQRKSEFQAFVKERNAREKGGS